MTISTLGMRALCGSSCSYEYQSDALVPKLTSFSVIGKQLQMSMQNLQSFTANDITVEFGDTWCENYTLSSTTLTCDLPGSTYPSIPAGSHKPHIHFANLGYSLINSGVSTYNEFPLVMWFSPSTVITFIVCIDFILLEIN